MAYIDDEDLFETFGRRNVEAWADLDGDADTVEIAARIAAAITHAESYVLDRMRAGQYAIPLVAQSSNALVTIKHAMAQVAGWKLYIARGFRDNDIVESRMTGHKEEAEAFLDKVLSGQILLDLTRSENGPNTPVVI